MAYNPRIQVTPLPPSNNIERLQEIQRLTADPKKSLTDPIKAAQLIKYYSPQTLLERTLREDPKKIAAAQASRGQAPVPTRPQIGVPASPPVAQPRRVFSEEGERILTAQGGGRAAIPQQIENVASRGRHGDTMLMHVNPQELRGLSSLLGPTTINPDTGLPEAFAWWLPLIGAAIGGIGAAATGHDWKKGLLFGGLTGLGGAFMMPAAAGSAASQAALAAGAAGQGGTALTQGALAAQLANPALATGLAPAGTMFGAAAPTYAGSLAGAGGSLVPAATQAGILSGATVPITAAGQGLTAGTPGFNIQNWGNLAQATRSAQGLPSTAPTWFDAANIQTGVQGMGATPATQLAGTVPKQTNWLQQALKSITGSGGDTTIQGGAKEDLLEAATKDTAKEAGLLSKFKSLSPLKRAAIVGGGSGLLGLLAQPKETDFGFQLPIKKVSEFDPSKFPTPEERKTKELTQEDIEERIFAGLPEEDRSYFEDATFAKKGGVIGRPAGGIIRQPGPLLAGPGGQQPPAGFTYVPGVGPMGASVLKPISEVGGTYAQPQHYQKAVLTPGGGGGGAPAPSPFEFPDVDPFQSSLSSFNVEDRLSRILGSSAVPQQFTLPSTSPTLPAIPASIPAANLQQGPSAMESLFSRFQQAQGDPIVDIVSESVAPAQQGGLIRLAVGGIGGLGPGTGGVSGGSFGLTGGSASGMAGSGAGVGGAGIGTGISQGPQTITVAPAVSRTGPIEGGEKTVTFTQPAPTPTVQSAPVTEGGKQLANTLNSIVSNVAQAKATLGPYGQMVSNMGILGMLGNMVFGEGSPMGLAGFSKALTNTGGYSPAIGLGAGPSLGTEDPYYVENPILEEGPMATGSSAFVNQGGPVGLANGGNPVFSGHLQGIGDGMSDQIPFRVVPQTPQDIPNTPDMAVLSTDEYVFPADAVSMLGNGSSNAGAKILDDAVKRVRQASIGTPKQIKEIDGQSVLGGALTT